MTRHLTRHRSQQRWEQLHQFRPWHQSYHRTKRSRRKTILINPWRRTLLKDSAFLSALTYWHNWPISQLVLSCMSYSAYQRKQERYLGMRLLTQNHFWFKCLPSLQMKTGPIVPNVIWYNNKHHASLSLPRTCTSKTTGMIDLCIMQGTLGLHTWEDTKSIQGLL